MVITIKSIYKLFILFLSLFIFNVESIDSNSDKFVLYDKINIHNEDNFTLYFKNAINSYDLEKKLNGLKIDVLNYIIDGEKYYAKNINELIEKYIENKSLEEKIYYKLKGIVIDGINVYCENGEVIKLTYIENIY